MTRLRLVSFLGFAVVCLSSGQNAEPFDAAPFSLRLPEGNGVMWEDPREIHQVIAEFDRAAPAPEDLRLEYWGSRWPEQHLPKDREPGGGDVGWMELGNWYKGGWRVADADIKVDGSRAVFTFRPVNAHEFPNLKDYAATFRYTLKLRIAFNSKPGSPDRPAPKLVKLQASTDSVMSERAVKLAWGKAVAKPKVEVFNGWVQSRNRLPRRREAEAGEGAPQRLADSPATHTGLEAPFLILVSANSDPNSFDRTLLTVRAGKDVFTFYPDDLARGPLFIPDFQVAVLDGNDSRDYSAVAAAVKDAGQKTLYDRVGEMPEQTWRAAWEGMPPKKSRIYFPMALDGGRQKFMLEADGSVRLRCNDHFLKARPGQETPRFDLEPAPVRLRLGPDRTLKSRSLEASTLPICETAWESAGLRVFETDLVTDLEGAKKSVSPGDAFAVFCAKLVFTNDTPNARLVTFPVSFKAGNSTEALRADSDGRIWHNGDLRAQMITDATNQSDLTWTFWIPPNASKTVIFKLPYVPLTSATEQASLSRLDFETERNAVASYWRSRMSQTARLVTPEPMLNDFYKAEATHLLINCEREPGSDRRFARVGSFAYGAYGNESCMMVVDLDRRGYHREAEECLDAWLHFQGSVELPGDFDSKEGVLYGAGGYEAGGYNQHHGWILWMLAEHYRFTRDEAWLRRSAQGILAGADWIIGQTKRTAGRADLERGLLPAGSLEDIGDWWTWLSTSCYTWRGLDSAAWALEQINHPQARRIRREAGAFHANLLAHFRAAAQRSPVVRLRDRTAVPHFPSQVHRRGRSFGWICETLEGAIHLLITGALDAHSPEAAWILKDYEDNLYLSNQYGYTLENFDKDWFGRGGMSMQACLLLDVEPYLARDDVKHALRAMFNAIAVCHFPDVHMNTEHALPNMGDWRGDHFKTSDEANACGWLRQIFLREQGDDLLIGQAVPRDWLKPGLCCGLENAATWFGPVAIRYTASDGEILAHLDGPRRNPPSRIRLRFRVPGEQPLGAVMVNGKPWKKISADWVELPGNIGTVDVSARFKAP